MAITAHQIRGKIGNLRACAWRRLTAVVAVYALVLQAFAFGLAGGQIAANAATDQSSPGFELCLHDVDSTPSAPAPVHGDHVHCIFCMAGGHHAFVPPPLSPLAILVPVGGAALPPAGDWRRPAPTHSSSAQPRGPPLAA